MNDPRRRSLSLLLSVLSAVIGAACSSSGAFEHAARRTDSKALGADDRKDVFAHPDARLRAIAARASVVLVDALSVDERNPADVRPSAATETLGAFRNLCTSEPFRDDPTMGSCSGALIDDDLVLTAGHCVATTAECASTRIVFGFYKTGRDALHAITKDDVFRCKERLVFHDGSVGGARYDHAIIRLDRVATPRFQPTAVRTSVTAMPAGRGVAIVGYGDGIPAKIETGARVMDGRATSLDFFVGTTDAYGGSSGSPVLDTASYELAGILVRGEGDDYVNVGDCSVSRRCHLEGGAAGGCTGIDSSYAHVPVAKLCANAAHARRYPHLCGALHACGNGRCEASEGSATCPEDCAATK